MHLVPSSVRWPVATAAPICRSRMRRRLGAACRANPTVAGAVRARIVHGDLTALPTRRRSGGRSSWRDLMIEAAARSGRPPVPRNCMSRRRRTASSERCAVANRSPTTLSSAAPAKLAPPAEPLNRSRCEWKIVGVAIWRNSFRYRPQIDREQRPLLARRDRARAERRAGAGPGLAGPRKALDRLRPTSACGVGQRDAGHALRLVGDRRDEAGEGARTVERGSAARALLERGDGNRRAASPASVAGLAATRSPDGSARRDRAKASRGAAARPCRRTRRRGWRGRSQRRSARSARACRRRSGAGRRRR